MQRIDYDKYNTIILYKGTAKMNREEFLVFNQYDTLNNLPKELARWKIGWDDDAYIPVDIMCDFIDKYISSYNNDECKTYDVTEYGLYFCVCDEDGNIDHGVDGDWFYATEKPKYKAYDSNGMFDPLYGLKHLGEV